MAEEKKTKKTAEATPKSEAKKPIKKPAKTSKEVIQDSETIIQDTAATKPLAKAGKRSEKALKETDEKLAKEERKQSDAEDKSEHSKPAVVQKSRPILERRSKGFRNSSKLIDQSKTYSLKEALDLATKTSHVKFDASVELHVNLGVDPRQADQNLRAMVALPAGTGKTIRVAVFADTDQIASAKKAGADIAKGEEFLQDLDKGTIDFDILISTPSNMAKLSKYARLLGPKGLMPNPKSGTVTTDVAKAVTEAKAGKVEYRVDSTGIVHLAVGKVSFGSAKLLENVNAIMNSIKTNKPSGLKGNYVRSIHVTTSMGPSIRVSESE